MIPFALPHGRVPDPDGDSDSRGSTRRASTPVVGVLLLVAITVIGAATVGLAASATPPDPAPTAAIGLSVDADAERITLTHEGGDPIDLTETSLRVEVDGTELTHQPPVPFFAATGFESGPTGPFNTATPDRWRPGQSGTLRLAGTNDPRIDPGSKVTVTVVSDGTVIATVDATASPAGR